MSRNSHKSLKTPQNTQKKHLLCVICSAFLTKSNLNQTSTYTRGLKPTKSQIVICHIWTVTRLKFSNQRSPVSKKYVHAHMAQHLTCGRYHICINVIPLIYIFKTLYDSKLSGSRQGRSTEAGNRTLICSSSLCTSSS